MEKKKIKYHRSVKELKIIISAGYFRFIWYTIIDSGTNNWQVQRLGNLRLCNIQLYRLYVLRFIGKMSYITRRRSAANKNRSFFSGLDTKASPPPPRTYWPQTLFFSLVLKQPKTDFDNNKKFSKKIRLKEPYLDVILYLGNQRYHPLPH